MTRPPTWIRPMRRWWLRLPFYRWYLLREATCVFVAAYALGLLAGLLCVAAGPDAYGVWRAVISSPLSIVFHGIAVLAFGFHAWTWLKVIPKTLPFVRFAGRRIPDRAIISGAMFSSLLASALLFVLAWAGLR